MDFKGKQRRRTVMLSGVVVHEHPSLGPLYPLSGRDVSRVNAWLMFRDFNVGGTPKGIRTPDLLLEREVS